MSELITKKELSEILKVTERTIDKWRTNLNLPFYKFGKEIKFKLIEIEEWAKERGK